MAEFFSAPNNRLKVQREEVLGWAKQQLADFARAEVKVDLSAKTIERVERNRGFFARVTFTKILQVVNIARARNFSLPPITVEDLFPTLESKPDDATSTNEP